MKYIESITAPLLEMQLFEMVFSRKEVANKIIALQDVIAEHVLLINLVSDNTAVQHWRHELNNWLSTINGYYIPTKSKLSSEKYFDLLWRGHFEDTDIVASFITKTLPFKFKDYDLKYYNTSLVESNIKNFYLHTSKLLSEKGTTYEDIKNLVDKL